VKTKICSGPAHSSPTELPLTEFYLRKSKGRMNEPVSRCKKCCNWSKLKNPEGDHGTIPAEKVRPILQEVVGRIGLWNSIRMTEISENTITCILNGTTERVQKKTAAKILATLRKLRKQGIAYHKTDIAAGVATRRKLRTVKRPSEQYGPIHPELEAEFRAAEAARKREQRKRLKEAKKFQESNEERLQDLIGY
jgi:hypothetical protein